MDIGLESLGKLTFLRTYSKGGAEDYYAAIRRYLQFMVKQYPAERSSIYAFGSYLYDKKIVASQRLLQFAGPVAEQCNSRAYNCSFVAPTTFKDFADITYLLMQGCGVGSSVQSVYVRQIPRLSFSAGEPNKVVIEDTKEAWADSFETLLKEPLTFFSYEKLRPAGAPLSSGGIASGPQVLIEAHEAIRKILFSCSQNNNRHLTSVAVADILCHISQAVISGGGRRSAMIILTDQADQDMASFKAGTWYIENPQRSQANKSSMCAKDTIEVRAGILEQLNSPYGERGIVLYNPTTWGMAEEPNHGINPCAEISLPSRNFCNLSSIIIPNLSDVTDFWNAAEAAAYFGTLQAGLTNFRYIHPQWAENAKRDALIGVSMTGVAQAKDWLTSEAIRDAAGLVVICNKRTAERIGTNAAKRTTCVKPEGSTSCVMGCTSGIHAAHFEYGVRRVRVTKLSQLAQKLISLYGVGTCKYSFIVDDVYGDKNIVLQFPCHYENAIYRKNEGAVGLLERMKVIYENWIKPGHIEGVQTNNVSITVSFKEEEKEELTAWLLNNQDSYRAISTLPYDPTGYELTPFEETTYEEYQKYLEQFPTIDWEALQVQQNISGSSACSAGGCELTSI